MGVVTGTMKGAKRGDVVRFLGTDEDSLVLRGQEVTITKLDGDGDYYVQGIDTEDEENGWYILPTGVLRDSEVKVELIPRPELGMVEGTNVLVYGKLEEGVGLTGVAGTVTRIDKDGDYWVEFVDPPLDPSDDEPIEGFYVDSTGTGTHDDYHAFVTVVTTSAHEAKGFAPGDKVVIYTSTVHDNHGVTIDGLVGDICPKNNGNGTRPDNAAWWVSLVDSKGQFDGFYITFGGKATGWGDMHVRKIEVDVDQAAPAPAYAKAMDQIMAEVQQRAVEYVNAAKTKDEPADVQDTIEYGHRDPQGTVFPWHKDFGPFKNRPVKINGVMCEPVKRRVVTTWYGWEDVK